MAVNLLRFSVFTKETTQNPHPSHPNNFLWHTSIGSSLPLTITTVASLSFSSKGPFHSWTWVYCMWLLYYQSIFNQFLNILTWIMIYPNLVHVIFLNEHLREFALAISVVSLGSSQTFFLPHFSTLAANLFCNLNVLHHVINKDNGSKKSSTR